MPRIPWDAPASEVVPGLPSDISWRVYIYRACCRTSYKQVAQTMRDCGWPDYDAHVIKSGVERLARGLGQRRCPRCGRETTSQHYCSECQNDAREGTLTSQERERLADHYANAATFYKKKREVELTNGEEGKNDATTNLQPCPATVLATDGVVSPPVQEILPRSC